MAIRKKSFTVKTKIHEKSEKIQGATWSLTEGRLLPTIHFTGIYISPSPKTSPREIKDFYYKLNKPFHAPSPPTSMRRYSDHNHLYTGDLNAQTGTEIEKHISHAEKTPPRKGDPSHTPSVNTPSGQSKISAQALGRLLLDFLEPNSPLILNERFQKPSDPILYTTKYNTIVDCFILPKTLLSEVTHCTAYPDSWKNILALIRFARKK